MRSLAFVCALFLASTAHADGKDVDLKAADGTLLKATYHSPGKPGPGVLLLHMCNSKRQAWSGLAARLVAKGMHVLTFDYRGYGESGGKPFKTLTPEETRRTREELFPGDVDRAFDFLVAQPGVDRARLGAGGASCGVNNAIQLARRKSPDVKTLVMLAGGTDKAGEVFLAGAPWLPIFAAAARDDDDAVGETGWVMRFSSNPMNQMKEYVDGGHGTNIFPVHKDLEPAIAAWFERQLVTQPVRATPGGAANPGPSAQLAAKLREPGAATRALAELAPEGVINALGYEHLQAGRTQDAIDMFSLNVEVHPDSANAYDSLSDAYVAAKDTAKAQEYARKALDALPRDKHAGEDTKKAIRESAEAKLRRAK